MNREDYYNTKEFVEKALEHYKNVHKHWKDRKWTIESSTIFSGEKSHTINYKDLPYNDYAKFQIGEDGKMTRIHFLKILLIIMVRNLPLHTKKKKCAMMMLWKMIINFGLSLAIHTQKKSLEIGMV